MRRTPVPFSGATGRALKSHAKAHTKKLIIDAGTEDSGQRSEVGGRRSETEIGGNLRNLWIVGALEEAVLLNRFEAQYHLRLGGSMRISGRRRITILSGFPRRISSWIGRPILRG